MIKNIIPVSGRCKTQQLVALLEETIVYGTGILILSCILLGLYSGLNVLITRNSNTLCVLLAKNLLLAWSIFILSLSIMLAILQCFLKKCNHE